MVKCKAGTSVQVILNRPQALARITRSYSHKKTSWRCGVDWLSGISLLILQHQSSTGWKKEGEDSWVRGCHRATLKSVGVPASGHKRPALRESSSLSAGFFFLLSSLAVCVLSHCSLIPLCVLPSTPSCLTNSASLLISSVHFPHFPLPVYVNNAPSVLYSPVPPSRCCSPDSLSLHPHPLPWFSRV